MKTNLHFPIFLLTLFFSVSEKINAQAPSCLWSKSFGGIRDDQCNSITVDAAGNVYSTGSFSGTVDFDPGAGVYNLGSGTNNNVFISKLDAFGNLVWAKRIGGIGGIGTCYSYSIGLDASGNVYTTGTFSLTTDFDPDSLGSFNLTATSSRNIFISKLDNSGNFVWAKALGYGKAQSIALDVSGNVYTTGSFEGTVDFDPGAGTFNLTAVWADNIFISKLDSSGNFIWAKAMIGSPGNGSSIALDDSGNVYLTGYFRDSVDFNPDTATFNLTSSGSEDIFISKLDNSGNFVWAKRLGGASNNGDRGYSIAIDASGNVYTTGYFAGDAGDVADFDPGPGTFNLTTIGYNEIFISKLNSSGNFVWAKSLGGSLADVAFSMALDASSNIYTTGVFGGGADFDPGPGTFALISSGGYNIFISKLDSSGNFQWAKALNGGGNNYGQALAISNSGNVYAAGYFNGPIVSSGCTTTPSAGGSDVFIVKLDTASVTGNLEIKTLKAGVLLIPNPATNHLIIDFPGNQNIVQLTIADIAGKIIYRTGATESKHLEINTNDFAEGIYIVQVQTGDLFEMKKLVVSK